MRTIHRARSAFTLVEIVVAMTLFGLIMMSVFLVYSNVIAASRQLEMTRIIQDNVRLITETIAREVAQSGIDIRAYHPPLEVINAWSGNTILALRSANKYYVMNAWGIACSDTQMAKMTTTNDCFMGIISPTGSVNRLSDDRVKIRSLRFFISGSDGRDSTNMDRVAKVTIVFDMSIAPSRGTSAATLSGSVVRIQTTVSERPYQQR